jgi:biotin transport system substrate-specific component
MTKTASKILNTEISMTKTQERAVLIVSFSLIMFFSSMIKIFTPFSPVPFTLQTMALFMAVYFLDFKELGLSQVLYRGAGLIGAPVFAMGLAGAFALVGPTAGYLMGFIVAGAVMSVLKTNLGKSGFAGMAAVFAVGTVIIYAFGAAHLHFVYGMTLKNAILAGVAPFVLTDAVKIAAAASFNKIGK